MTCQRALACNNSQSMTGQGADVKDLAYPGGAPNRRSGGRLCEQILVCPAEPAAGSSSRRPSRGCATSHWRTVVRRIEIDDSRIEVIFRVPSPDPSGPASPTKTIGSWQHCTGVGSAPPWLARPGWNRLFPVLLRPLAPAPRPRTGIIPRRQRGKSPIRGQRDGRNGRKALSRHGIWLRAAARTDVFSRGRIILITRTKILRSIFQAGSPASTSSQAQPAGVQVVQVQAPAPPSVKSVMSVIFACTFFSPSSRVSRFVKRHAQGEKKRVCEIH